MGSEKEPKDESETPAFHGFEGMLQDLTPGAAKAKAAAADLEPPTLKKPPVSKPTPQVVLPKVAAPPVKAPISTKVIPVAKLPPPPVKLPPPARTARLSPTPVEAEVAGQEEPEPLSAVPESSLTVDASEVELLDPAPAAKAEPPRASGERFPTLKALEEKPKEGGHGSLVIVALGLALAGAIAWTLTRPPRPSTGAASATSTPVGNLSATAQPSASAQASAAPSASAAATALPSATASAAPSASASAAPTSTAVAAVPTARPTSTATATHAPVATTPPPPTVTTPPPPPTQPPPPPPPTSTGNPLLNAP